MSLTLAAANGDAMETITIVVNGMVYTGKTEREARTIAREDQAERNKR